MRTATNPQTGEKFAFIAGKWVPVPGTTPPAPPPEPEGPGIVDRFVTGPLQRGAGQAIESGAVGLGSLGAISPETAADYALRGRKMAEAAPRTPEDEAGLREIGNAETLGQAGKAILRNPGATASVAVESLPQSAGSLILSAIGAIGGGITGGPIGAALGMAAGAGAGSYATEYAASLAEVVRNAGGDPDDPEDLKLALGDQNIMAQAKERALRRAVPVAAFDALSGGLAGRLVSGAKGVTSFAGRSAGELGIQSGAGAAGEALAQQRVGEYRPGDIGLEAAAEIPGGVVETAIGAATKGRGAEKPTAAQEAAPARAPADAELIAIGQLPDAEARAAIKERFGVNGIKANAVLKEIRAEAAAAPEIAPEIITENITGAPQAIQKPREQPPETTARNSDPTGRSQSQAIAEKAKANALAMLEGAWTPIRESEDVNAPIVGYINEQTGQQRTVEEHRAGIETPLSGLEPQLPAPAEMAAQVAEARAAVVEPAEQQEIAGDDGQLERPSGAGTLGADAAAERDPGDDQRVGQPVGDADPDLPQIVSSPLTQPESEAPGGPAGAQPRGVGDEGPRPEDAGSRSAAAEAGAVDQAAADQGDFPGGRGSPDLNVPPVGPDPQDRAGDPSGQAQPPLTFTPNAIDTEDGRPVQVAVSGPVRTVRFADGTERQERAARNPERYQPLEVPDASPEAQDAPAAGVAQAAQQASPAGGEADGPKLTNGLSPELESLIGQYVTSTMEFNDRRTKKARRDQIIQETKRLRTAIARAGGTAQDIERAINGGQTNAEAYGGEETPNPEPAKPAAETPATLLVDKAPNGIARNKARKEAGPRFQPSNSWVVVDRATNKPVLETFEQKTADAVNLDKYEVVPAGEWLARLNKPGPERDAASTVPNVPKPANPTDPFLDGARKFVRESTKPLTPANLMRELGIKGEPKLAKDILKRLVVTGDIRQAKDLSFRRKATQRTPKGITQFIASLGGIATKEKGEITDAPRMVPGYGPLFRKQGRPLDDLAQSAHDAGYLKERDPDELVRLIEEEMRGKKQVAITDLSEQMDMEDARKAEANAEWEADVLGDLRAEITAQAVEDGIVLTNDETDQAARLVSQDGMSPSAAIEWVTVNAGAEIVESEPQTGETWNDESDIPFAWEPQAEPDEGPRPGGQAGADQRAPEGRPGEAQGRGEDRPERAETGGEVGVFETYAEAQVYIDRRAKEEGGRNKFAASDEYKAVFPQIDALYQAEKATSADAAMKRLSDAGLKVGDKVEARLAGSFMTMEERAGTIVDRDGFPYVRLDGPKLAVVRDGKVRMAQSVRWDSRWQKPARTEKGAEGFDQLIIPGAEPSVQQAMDARKRTGIAAKKRQQPADEGIFAPPEDDRQAKLQALGNRSQFITTTYKGRESKPFEVVSDPTDRDVRRLIRENGERAGDDGAARVLFDRAGRVTHAWDASRALHVEVADALNLSKLDTEEDQARAAIATIKNGKVAYEAPNGDSQPFSRDEYAAFYFPQAKTQAAAGPTTTVAETVRLAANVIAGNLPDAEAARLRAEIDAELRPLLKRLAGDRADLKVFDALQSTAGDAVGGAQVRDLIAIAVLDGGRVRSSEERAGTLRHEVLHLLRETNAIPPAAWSALEAKADNWITTLGIKNQPAYAGLTQAQQREEAIAEAYARWARGELKLAGSPQAGFRAIRRFLDALRGIVAKALGLPKLPRPQDVFEAIERGDYAGSAASGMTEINGVPVAGYKTNKLGGAMQVRAYHGSPHTFDRFDLSKIGTGEGAQAYGHGLYFAENEGVAKQYRENLAYTSALKNKTWRAPEGVPPDVAEAAKAHLGGFFGYSDPEYILKTTREAAKEVESTRAYVARLEKQMAETPPEIRERWSHLIAKQQDEIDMYRRQLAHEERASAVLPHLEKHGVEAFTEPGSLYTVSLDVEPEDLLDWDKPLSQQSEKVRKALEEAIENAANDSPRFAAERVQMAALESDDTPTSDWIKSLEHFFDPRDVSARLRATGIPGIRYLDGGSRSSGEGTSNYVIFDDSLVQITARLQTTTLSRGAMLRDVDQGALIDDLTTENAGLLTRVMGPNMRGRAGAYMDRARRLFQDRFLFVRRTQEEAERMLGRPLGEDEDAYLAEELFHGKVGEQKFRQDKDFREPIIDAMHNAGLTLAEVDDFLTARHAPERNAAVAEINPKFPDGGSGMTDAEAEAIISGFNPEKRAALDAIGELVDQMMARRLTNMVDSGILSASEADAYRSKYRHYVPLRGVPADPNEEALKPTQGRGFMGSRKREKRAMGRGSRAEDILATAFTLSDEAIVRGEKNRVAQALLNLAMAAPDPAVWEVNPVEREAYMAKLPDGRQQVRYRYRPHYSGSDTVSVRVDGREFRIRVKDADLLRAFANLGGGELNVMLAGLSHVTRTLSKLNTMWSPEFIVSNAFMDLQSGLINLSQEEARGLQREVAGNWRRAFSGAKGYITDGQADTDWKRWAKEFRENGGQTAFNDLVDADAQAKGIEQAVKDLEARNASRARRAIKTLGDTIERWNTGVDNAVRLSTYAALRGRGYSPSRAASVAKNLTVNFNRKGEMGPALNALFMFFNAGAQGTAVLARAIYRSPKVRAVVAGIVVAGAIQEIMGGMFDPPDDDEDGIGLSVYDRIPEWEKQSNMIIPYGTDPGDYVKIRMPYGYNFFHNLGRLTAAYARGAPEADGKAVGLAKTIAKLAGSFAQAIIPPGLSELGVPSIASPFVDIARNENFFGGPIMPTSFPGDDKPASQTYFPSVNPLARETADFLNRVTGGDEFRPGLVDVSPNAIMHVLTTYAGAAGALVTSTIGNISRAQAELRGVNVENPQLDLSDVPFARRVMGTASPWQARDITYQRLAEIEILADQKKAGAPVENRRLLALADDARKLRRELSTMRKQRRAIVADETLPVRDRRARTERIDAREREAMAAFNRRYIRALQ